MSDGYKDELIPNYEELARLKIEKMDEVIDHLIHQATVSGYKLGWTAGAIAVFDLLKKENLLTAEGDGLGFLNLLLENFPQLQIDKE